MAEVLNILCLEDSPQDAEILHELLTDAGYHLNMDCTAVEKEFVSFLRSNRYDIILADFKLPGFDGFTALRWSVEICPDVPFICISGTVGEETAVELLKKGAVDYILKDRLVRLPSAVQRALEQHRIQIEKRATELLLKENEEKLQSIFSAAPVGIGLVVDRVFIEVNDTFCKMTGYNRAELTGENTEMIYSTNEEYKKVGIEKYRQIAEKGTGSVETSFMCKDGSVLDIFLSSSPLDKDDLTKGVTFTAMDITGKKQAATALLVSEEKYRRIFENVQDVFYETSMDGTIIEVSPSIKILSKGRYSRDELIGKSMNDFYADPKQRMCLMNILRENGFVSDYEIMLKNRDDTKIPCSISAKIIFDSADRPERINGTMRDITDRKLVEENLRNSEEKFRSIMENSADAIFITDHQGKYLYTNKAVTVMLGFTSEEMQNKTIIDFSPPEKAGEHSEMFKKVMSEGKVFAEIELLKKDGSFISTDLNSVLLPEGLIYGSCRDITERKHAKEELIKAKEKAEEGDRLKTAFLHNISHEIRTPMNAIVGFSGFLNNPGLLPEKRKYYTDIIIKSSDQLLSIIDNIICIASIEAGQDKIYENEININLICELINEQFFPNFSNNNVTLSLKTILADDKAIIITDAPKLTQIITNLIGNALKFTQQGFVNFGYAVKGSQLEFYVEDSGIGISSDMHDKIFNRFRQVETTDTRKFGGSGLGLSISKAYVELLGGKMWLTSELGKGSVFYFTIPYKKVNPQKLVDIPSIKDLRFEFKPPKTLLIAEDEDSNFMLLEELLSDTGINIIRAVNGLEAVEICKSIPNIDLVLMDIKMPKLNGYEATIKIKESRPDLYIIAQTAYSTEADKNKALACGCSDFMSKPIKRELLLSKINEQLHK